METAITALGRVMIVDGIDADDIETMAEILERELIAA